MCLKQGVEYIKSIIATGCPGVPGEWGRGRWHSHPHLEPGVKVLPQGWRDRLPAAWIDQLNN